MDFNYLGPFIIPAVAGVLIPFLTNALNRATALPSWLQSILYFALSALAAVIPTVTFDKDLKAYLIALGIAWLVSMRTHYTTIPDSLIPPYSPRHARDPETVDSSPS